MTPIIVRCTGLADTAEASDVRGFFAGLNIPAGGVHIIGGKEGYVYVSFVDYANAQQAVLRSGRLLCGEQLNLRISSDGELAEHMKRIAQDDESDQSNGSDYGGGSKKYETSTSQMGYSSGPSSQTVYGSRQNPQVSPQTPTVVYRSNENPQNHETPQSHNQNPYEARPPNQFQSVQPSQYEPVSSQRHPKREYQTSPTMQNYQQGPPPVNQYQSPPGQNQYAPPRVVSPPPHVPTLYGGSQRNPAPAMHQPDMNQPPPGFGQPEPVGQNQYAPPTREQETLQQELLEKQQEYEALQMKLLNAQKARYEDPPSVKESHNIQQFSPQNQQQFTLQNEQKFPQNQQQFTQLNQHIQQAVEPQQQSTEPPLMDAVRQHQLEFEKGFLAGQRRREELAKTQISDVKPLIGGRSLENPFSSQQDTGASLILRPPPQAPMLNSQQNSQQNPSNPQPLFKPTPTPLNAAFVQPPQPMGFMAQQGQMQPQMGQESGGKGSRSRGLLSAPACRPSNPELFMDKPQQPQAQQQLPQMQVQQHNPTVGVQVQQDNSGGESLLARLNPSAFDLSAKDKDGNAQGPLSMLQRYRYFKLENMPERLSKFHCVENFVRPMQLPNRHSVIFYRVDHSNPVTDTCILRLDNSEDCDAMFVLEGQMNVHVTESSRLEYEQAAALYDPAALSKDFEPASIPCNQRVATALSNKGDDMRQYSDKLYLMFDNVAYRATGAHLSPWLIKNGIEQPKSFKMVPSKDDMRYSGTWLVECANREAYEKTLMFGRRNEKLMDRTVYIRQMPSDPVWPPPRDGGHRGDRDMRSRRRGHRGGGESRERSGRRDRDERGDGRKRIMSPDRQRRKMSPVRPSKRQRGRDWFWEGGVD